LTTSPKILTIVVTYNSMSWIDKCTESLLDSDQKTDIIIIDNASSDGIGPYLLDKYPSVHFSQNSSNLGFGAANNIGFRYAIDNSYDFVFLLNQDAYVYPDTLTKLFSSCTVTSSNSLISPLHLNYEGIEIESGCLHFIKEGIELSWYNNMIKPDNRNLFKIDFINAAAWFIPVAIVEKIGGFDPLFFQYGEDNDWVSRLSYYGYDLTLDIHSKICHKSNFKTWNQVAHDPARVVTSYLVELKNPKASLKSNLFLLLQREIDRASTFLLLGKLNSFFFTIRQLLKLLPKIYLVHKSRRLMRVDGAYFT
jgi:GT2 family glycosyltransferase